MRTAADPIADPQAAPVAGAFVAAFVAQLRARAEERRREGANTAAAFDLVATELEETWARWQLAELSPAAAAEASGYSVDAMRKLQRELGGVLRRGNLPQKASPAMIAAPLAVSLATSPGWLAAGLARRGR